MARIKTLWKAFAAGYVRFVERQGFLVILIVCIGVIAGTAAWTNQSGPTIPVPTPPAGNDASVAQLQQQWLKDVSTPTPAPTPQAVEWQAPLEQLSVLQAFNGARMSPSGITGLWRLHDAVDLRCSTGEQIFSMASGTVTEVCDKGLMGAYVIIDHGNGLVAQYAGMSLTAGLRKGDPVEGGQLIGFGGNGVLDESDMEPHLHLRVTQDGSAMDPLSLFAGKR